MSKIKLYDLIESQNGYKVRLALSVLKVDYEFISLDLRKGEHKKEWFLSLNPNGQIPTLVDDDFPIWESNAILLYLGRKFAPQGLNGLIPQDVKKLGIMLEWMMFEATKLQPYLQPCRFMTTVGPKFFPNYKADEAKLKDMRDKSNFYLKILDNHLAKNNFITGEYSMADIACYGQIYPASEGGIDLSKFPNITSWQKRVEKEPGYVEMRAKTAV